MDNEIRIVEAIQNLQKRVNEVTDVDYQTDDGDRYIRVKVPQGLPGKNGKDGKDGKDGRDGLPGKDGINGKDGKDGKPGINGRDGLPGKDGKNGIDGKDGKDGVSIHNVYVKNGHLHIALTDGNDYDCGYIIGAPGGNGVSVKSAYIANNHLYIELTNHKTIDCGEVGGGGTGGVTSVNGMTGDVVIDLTVKQDVATLETDVKSFIDKSYILSLLDDGDGVYY